MKDTALEAIASSSGKNEKWQRKKGRSNCVTILNLPAIVRLIATVSSIVSLSHVGGGGVEVIIFHKNMQVDILYNPGANDITSYFQKAAKCN